MQRVTREFCHCDRRDLGLLSQCRSICLRQRLMREQYCFLIVEENKSQDIQPELRAQSGRRRILFCVSGQIRQYSGPSIGFPLGNSYFPRKKGEMVQLEDCVVQEIGGTRRRKLRLIQCFQNKQRSGLHTAPQASISEQINICKSMEQRCIRYREAFRHAIQLMVVPIFQRMSPVLRHSGALTVCVNYHWGGYCR